MLEKIKIKKPILHISLYILCIAMFAQFSLSLILNVVGYYFDMKETIRKTGESKIDKINNFIERIVSLGVPINEIAQLNQELEKEVKDDVFQFFTVVDENNNILYHSDPIVVGTKFPIEQNKLEAKRELKVTIFPYNDVFLISKPIYDYKKTKVGFIIAAYSPNIIYKKVFWVFLRASFASFITGIFGIALIVYFYKKQIQKPLTTLLEGLEKFKEGKFEEIPIVDEDTEISAIISSINNMVTTLKKTFIEKETLLNKLKNEEEKLRKIIEKTEMGIAVIKNDKFVFANPGFLKILKIDYTYHLIGKSIYDFFSPSERFYFREAFNEVLETGQKKTFDTVKMYDAQNNEIFCSLEASILETSEWGKKLLNLTFQDITEKVYFMEELKSKNKELEQLIEKYKSTQLALQIANEKLENALTAVEKANEELKKIDNMKDVFFSTITHELKTPLSLIHGYISILKSDSNVKASNMTLDIVNAIERGAKRLTSLTEEIMELMKIRSGKLVLNPTLTYLKFIINPLINELDPLLKSKNLHIELYNIEQMPMISLDTKKFETALRNIIVNSIKYCKENGKIIINATQENIDDKKFIKIAISDEGCGISPFNIEKIFTEFFTLPPPQSGKELPIRGTGLGLSIAKGIIEAHGGKIWAESPGYDPENNPGTTFFITIPIID
ncbi:MAG: ATP-binding protein [Proteobacteria bacterium]|nr:ATP-binding protein [Pseudomonadota bacterium]